MADRYDDRYRGQTSRGERGYGHDDRGLVERAGDEVRSWFGDDEARRRRRMDERESGRGRDEERMRGRDIDRTEDTWSARRSWSDRDYGDRGWSGERERGWAGERTGSGARWGGDEGRTDYGRRDDYTRFDESRGSGWTSPSSFGYGPGIWSSETSAGRSWSPTGSGRFEEGRAQESWRPGSFAGRGPKGYQRSDARINEDVCDRLADSPDVDATEIEVTVRNGEVTLSGTVSDRMQKRRSEDLIENVAGVREVHNNLRVSSSQGMSQAPAQGAAAQSGRR